ncbi:MAG: cytochrome c [Planctomycetota bacterium]
MAMKSWQMLRNGLLVGTLLLVVGCVEKSKEIPAEMPDPAKMNAGGPPPGSEPIGAAMVGNQATSTHDIMEKIGEGPNSLTAQLDAAIKADPIVWEDLDKLLTEYTKLAGSMTSGRPPVGGTETWRPLTQNFVAKATAVQEAAKKKDKDATVAAFTQLTMTCAECHKSHKPGAKKSEETSEGKSE